MIAVALFLGLVLGMALFFVLEPDGRLSRTRRIGRPHRILTAPGGRMSKVEPALTPEEWADLQCDEGGGGYPEGDPYRPEGSVMIDEDGRILLHAEGDFRYPITRPHAAAALCLYRQPLGFTHGDVKELQWRIDEMRKVAQPVGPLHAYWDAISGLESIRDRIEALLPPEEP